LHQLSKIALTYNLIISTVTTKILALREKELIKTKIMINNTASEQVTNFNYAEGFEVFTAVVIKSIIF
jgi:hypothetical protein